MIHIAKLTKSISFSVSKKDKEKLQQKAEDIGIPLAAMIRNIVLDKYENLAIGYISSGIFSRKQDIDIKRLNPPKKLMKTEDIKFRTPDYINGYKECMNELKKVMKERKEILDQELILIS